MLFQVSCAVFRVIKDKRCDRLRNTCKLLMNNRKQGYAKEYR